MRRALLPIAAACALAACQAGVRPALAPQPRRLASPPAITQLAHPAWTRNAVIYEVNIRQFTPEGTFAALQQQLPRLRGLGVDILWLMPVQPIGTLKRKGVLGSYYSIADYRGINPEYGTAADFKALVGEAHRLGMKVILDWVQNHSAWDNPWITEHPDWYVHRKDGSISVPVVNGKETDWTDVAQLNYANPALREAMIAAMRWWVDDMGVDGFRCDHASGEPYDFWQQATTALRTDRPDLFLLAESEDPKLQAYFDMTYGWELHHLLNAIAQGKRGTSALDALLARQDSLFPPDAYRMDFTSDHDENSWAGTEFERMGADYAPGFVLDATLQNSMPLLYTGQEAGLNKRLRFFEKDTVAWGHPAFADFYRTIFALKHEQPALANGAAGGPQVKLVTDGGERVYAFTRTRGANTVLVAVNFGDAATTVTYSGLSRPGAYRDWFAPGPPVELPPTGKLDIPAHGFRVLVR